MSGDRLRRALTWLPGRIRLPRRTARNETPDRAQPAPQGALRVFRAAALWAVAVLILAASGAAFAESYQGLYEWARHHGKTGVWATLYPVQVDVFIAVPELVLFVAMVDGWKRRHQAGAWMLALIGLAVSVAGNIGHVVNPDLQSRATAAVPPLAAFAALWLGLRVVKRVIEHRGGETVQTAPDVMLPEIPADAEVAALLALRATTWAGNPLSGRQLETRFGLTRQQVTRVRQGVLAEANGRRPEDSKENADL